MIAPVLLKQGREKSPSPELGLIKLLRKVLLTELLLYELLSIAVGRTDVVYVFDEAVFDPALERLVAVDRLDVESCGIVSVLLFHFFDAHLINQFCAVILSFIGCVVAFVLFLDSHK